MRRVIGVFAALCASSAALAAGGPYPSQNLDAAAADGSVVTFAQVSQTRWPIWCRIGVCAKFTPLEPAPWRFNERIPGDEWGLARLLIDEDGRVIGCELNDTNMRNPDRRGYLCLAFEQDWYTAPIAGNDQGFHSWITRPFIVMGDRHFEADWKARERFCSEHRPQLPECSDDF
jgi:hypothetical protein